MKHSIAKLEQGSFEEQPTTIMPSSSSSSKVVRRVTLLERKEHTENELRCHNQALDAHLSDLSRCQEKISLITVYTIKDPTCPNKSHVNYKRVSQSSLVLTKKSPRLHLNK